MHRHCCWLFYRFVPLWKQENCPHRITLCGDYRDGFGSREERKSALLVQERIQQGALVQSPFRGGHLRIGDPADANPDSRPSLTANAQYTR